MKKKILVVTVLLLIVIAGLAGGYYYFTVPQNVRVTNVTSSAAVVSWTTRAPLKGKVSYNQVNNQKTTKTEEEKRYNHYIELDNLEDNSTYQFRPGTKVLSYNASSILADNFTLTKEKLEFTTFEILENPITPSYIYGLVVCDTEECYENSVVYVEVEGLTPISTTVNESGGWSIDFSASRDASTGGTPITTNNLGSTSFYAESSKYGSSEIINIDDLTLGKKVKKNLVVKEK